MGSQGSFLKDFPLPILVQAHFQKLAQAHRSWLAKGDGANFAGFVGI